AAQELVNLLMTGRAHPHVFDGERALDDTAAAAAAAAAAAPLPPPLLLRGVPARGRVGFLTLFEAYGHVSVGAHYKRPAAPVWVVCSESHYSALFACNDAAAGAGAGDGDDAAHEFDLFYYDPLGQQDETIRLSIDTRPRVPPPGPDAAAAGALVPPLDLVVRTRWPGAAVDWNGTDPIL
ncbi:FAM188B-like protein, partial [Tribonema minus]